MPMTAKEISLMLRSGYSSEAVGRDLAARHFGGSCDAATEKMLLETGASKALIDALKSGKFAVPPEEITRVKEELVAREKRRAAMAEESRKFNTLYQSNLARERSLAAAQPTSPNNIYPLVKGDLVCWKNGSLSHFDDESFEKKKLIALYFSAHWCGPCRTFTPQLVEYYNRIAPHHPEFELLLISNDRSQFGMETYMRDMQMPWPAVDYQKLSGKVALTKYAGNGIPDLVLIDASGKVLSDSYAGREYLGPQKVLADLDSIFANGGAGQVAQSR
ncbi:MAG: thioredoxin domain-containing protein [Verrucomicrobiota bacterium]|nr:thioredoxin domain-containing protein [Verrucomicrobiota bacterium]